MEGVFDISDISYNFEETDMRKYPAEERAGVRDRISNYFYDLSILNSSLTNFITGVKLIHNGYYIHSLEFFYDGFSSGIFSGKVNEKEEKEKLFELNINIQKGDYIEAIIGSFSADYITELIFFLKSGNKRGFSYVKYNSTKRTDLKSFKFELNGSQIYGLNMAFGKCLTFISPIFKLLSCDNFGVDKEDPSLIFTKSVGKIYEDSIHFSCLKEFQENKNNLSQIKIKSIQIYHDYNLVKQIDIYYKIEGLNPAEFVIRIGQNDKLGNINYQCEKLELECDKGEEISSIMIRSGDLIDNLTIYSNKGKVISAGGCGGGPNIYNLDEIKNKNGYKSINFIGFEGGYKNNIHFLKLILRRNR